MEKPQTCPSKEQALNVMMSDTAIGLDGIRQRTDVILDSRLVDITCDEGCTGAVLVERSRFSLLRLLGSTDFEVCPVETSVKINQQLQKQHTNKLFGAICDATDSLQTPDNQVKLFGNSCESYLLMLDKIK